MKNLGLQVLVLIAGLSAAVSGTYFLYRRAHPRYVPPPPRQEVEITIIPGWNLRQVAEYLVRQGLASSTRDVYDITGVPAVMPTSVLLEPRKFSLVDSFPNPVSIEGYLAPDTYRVYADAPLQDVIVKLLDQRLKQLRNLQPVTIAEPINGFSQHEILTMGSIVEKEVKYDADRAQVADILWRRLARGWALQVDSTVHYAIGKTGDLFTTAKERQADSPWNTYKYPGLPPGPICNPGLESIKAALYPEKNNYWYFLSGRDGKIYYGKTLEEHNRNKRYL